jgi:hypothetical protein
MQKVNAMNIDAIETHFATLTYAQIAEKLRPFSDEDLLKLLDSKFNRIGDTAADLLMQREKHDLIIDAILNSLIKKAIGRLRASNILLPFGKRIPRAELAYLHLLGDKNSAIVSNALFGLVFGQNKKSIAAIEAAMSKAKPGSKKLEYFEKAIEALRRRDPFFYSPNFADLNDIWQVAAQRSCTDE